MVSGSELASEFRLDLVDEADLGASDQFMTATQTVPVDSGETLGVIAPGARPDNRPGWSWGGGERTYRPDPGAVWGGGEVTNTVPGPSREPGLRARL